jgi:hypothetical protein
VLQKYNHFPRLIPSALVKMSEFRLLPKASRSHWRQAKTLDQNTELHGVNKRFT